MEGSSLLLVLAIGRAGVAGWLPACRLLSTSAAATTLASLFSSTSSPHFDWVVYCITLTYPPPPVVEVHISHLIEGIILVL